MNFYSKLQIYEQINKLKVMNNLYKHIKMKVKFQTINLKKSLKSKNNYEVPIKRALQKLIIIKHSR